MAQTSENSQRSLLDSYGLGGPPSPLGGDSDLPPAAKPGAPRFDAAQASFRPRDFSRIFGAGPIGSAGLLDGPHLQRQDATTDPGPWARSSGRGPWAVPTPAQTIGPVPGFPENGPHAWRKANDQIFLDAANNYNSAKGLKPEDPGYWTGMRLKAQAMLESGSDLDKDQFMTDPLQVNKAGDWVPRKASIGLQKGQAMTPELSAAAALKWLNYKGVVHDELGRPTGWKGDVEALAHYNGVKQVMPGSSGQPKDIWYANRILELERAAKADAARGSGHE